MAYITLLLLTVVIELGVVMLFRHRTMKIFMVIVGVNLLTHPLLTLLIMVAYQWGVYHVAIVFVLEVLVVLVEWRLIVFAMREERRQYLILAVAMNVLSYGVGLVL